MAYNIGFFFLEADRNKGTVNRCSQVNREVRCPPNWRATRNVNRQPVACLQLV